MPMTAVCARFEKDEEGQGGKSIAIQDGITINENDSPSITPGLRALRGEIDSENWNRGSYAVASNSGSIKLNVPKDTQVGDTLFLLLR